VSPKPADPAVRTALLEVAARIIAGEGPGGLSLRRLAQEVGVSTMAIYTHFGSMTELRRCIRREGFARLGARQAQVAVTGDPVADLCVLGWVYYRNAVDNPNLYRAMFMEGPVDVTDAGVGLETFAQLVNTVHRCIDAGRFTPADPVHLAMQLWALNHGLVTLELAHLLSSDQVLPCLAASARNLLQAFGDDPRALGRSFSRAQERMVATPAAS
jgi:AcrR family transcriptional regulator